MSRFYVGGYSSDMGGSAPGIAILSSREDGSLAHDGYLATSESPVFLRREGSTLYAVGEGSGRFEAFELPSGRLLARVELGAELGVEAGASSARTAPCHITVTGNRALVSNYGDGSISVLHLDPVRLAQVVPATSTGGPHSEQLRPRVHSTLVVGDTVLSADFGADELHVHSWKGGILTLERSIPFPAGSGPRDLVLHRSGVVLVLTQLSNRVVVLSPEFEPVASEAVPGALEGDFGATLSLSSDQRFVFAAVRGSDLIATMAIDGTSVTGIGAVGSAGSRPRHHVVDGDILHVANQASRTVASFANDEGRLTLIAEPTPVASPTHLERA